MLMVIPDSYRRSLIVEFVPNDYGTRRRDEIQKILIAYFAMLRFSCTTGNKPPLFETAVKNTIEKANRLMARRTPEHIENLEAENSYIINALAVALMQQAERDAEDEIIGGQP